jgi:hypothetical protein
MEARKSGQINENALPAGYFHGLPSYVNPGVKLAMGQEQKGKWRVQEELLSAYYRMQSAPSPQQSVTIASGRCRGFLPGRLLRQ